MANSGAQVRPGGVDEGRGFVGERLGGGPDQLRGVHLDGGEDADHHAGEHGGEQDVAPRIFGFLRESGDAVEADIGEHRDGGASEHGSGGEGRGIVEGAREESGGVRKSGDVSRGADEEDGDHHSHAGGEPGIHGGRSANSLDVQAGEQQREENGPDPVGHGRGEDVGLLADPDDADDGIQHVVHDHAPSGDVAPARG